MLTAQYFTEPELEEDESRYAVLYPLPSCVYSPPGCSCNREQAQTIALCDGSWVLCLALISILDDREGCRLSRHLSNLYQIHRPITEHQRAEDTDHVQILNVCFRRPGPNRRNQVTKSSIGQDIMGGGSRDDWRLENNHAPNPRPPPFSGGLQYIGLALTLTTCIRFLRTVKSI